MAVSHRAERVSHGRRKKVGEPARLQSLDDVLPGRDGSTRLDATRSRKEP